MGPASGLPEHSVMKPHGSSQTIPIKSNKDAYYRLGQNLSTAPPTVPQKSTPGLKRWVSCIHAMRKGGKGKTNSWRNREYTYPQRQVWKPEATLIDPGNHQGNRQRDTVRERPKRSYDTKLNPPVQVDQRWIDLIVQKQIWGTFIHIRTPKYHLLTIRRSAMGVTDNSKRNSFRKLTEYFDISAYNYGFNYWSNRLYQHSHDQGKLNRVCQEIVARRRFTRTNCRNFERKVVKKIVKTIDNGLWKYSNYFLQLLCYISETSYNPNTKNRAKYLRK